MQLIKLEDFKKRRELNFSLLSKGDKFWCDEDKLLLEATIEVLTEKINELVKNRNA